MLRRAFLILISLVIYVYEFYLGAYLLTHPGDSGSLYSLCSVLIGIYALGLTRAWQLLGARRYGFLGWLNPLHEVNEKQHATNHEQE